jgi:hypothetical protein
MKAPTQADYVKVYFTLFERYEQMQAERTAHQGHPYVYAEKLLIVFFTIMLLRQIVAFKAQRRWLETHPQERRALGFPATPHRTTLSRRYKTISEVVEAFLRYLGYWGEQLDTAFTSHILVEDGSLFKAEGPVWHQSDRLQNRIPEGLRHLDTQAAWGKSGYHGWVYGYGLHLTCNLKGFPKLARVEPANVADSTVLEAKTEQLWAYGPAAVVGDNGYFKAMRVRNWAKHGVILLTPATKWKKGRYAKAYHRFRKHPQPAQWLRARGTAVEPMFDLLCKVLNVQDNHKQLPLQGLANVTTFLLLAVLAVQISMIVNNVWNRPLRQVSHMISSFS